MIFNRENHLIHINEVCKSVHQMDFRVGDILSITDICYVHKKKCTIKYKIINIGKRIQIEELDDCVIMGTHYCSSIDEPIYTPYLIIDNGRYALESEDYETARFNLDEVKIIK